MAEIKLHNVTKRYSGNTVVKHVNLIIEDGEFFILVGPSGCGKSTLLNMIVGLETVTEGDVEVDGRRITDLDPRERNMAMVFQSYALYPHMTVRENMAFPLKLARLPGAEIDRRVARAAGMLELGDNLDRKPGALSGGQRQRVAMGRALVREPSAFLLDEPLSNLDARLRVQMRAEISRLQRRLKTTTVYVTHDQTEAMTLGDRIAVLHKGAVMQIGTPRELYSQPSNLFVAGFIGSPAMNFLPARRIENHLELPVGSLVLPDKPDKLTNGDGNQLIAGFRPEHLTVAGETVTTSGGLTFKAKAAVTEWLGADLFVYFDVAPGAFGTMRLPEELALKTGKGDGFSLVARIDPAFGMSEGDTVQLHLEPGHLHLFDSRTGEKLHSRHQHNSESAGS